MLQASSPNYQRFRGFVLTEPGFQKLRKQIHALEVQTRQRQNSRMIAERVQLNSNEGIHPMTVRKILRCQLGVDRRSIQLVFHALQLNLEERDYAHARLVQGEEKREANSHSHYSPFWGDAREVVHFHGRTQELDQLKSWALGLTDSSSQPCQLISLLGMAGVGKTTLSAKLTEMIQPEFEFVFWRSLHQLPSLHELLAHLIQSIEPGYSGNLSSNTYELMLQVIHLFKQHRCLVVLDGVDVLLESGQLAGYYRPGYESYREFFKLVVEVTHQSCLVITSREQPRELGLLQGGNLQTLHVGGLSAADSRSCFEALGCSSGSPTHWNQLHTHCGGHPVALRLTAIRIREYLNGDIATHLEDLQQSRVFLQDLQDLFNQQFNRLSHLEKVVLWGLMHHAGRASLTQLRGVLATHEVCGDLVEALESLRRRSLLEKHPTYFKLSPVLMECVQVFLRQEVWETAPVLPEPAKPSQTALASVSDLDRTGKPDGSLSGSIAACNYSLQRGIQYIHEHLDEDLKLSIIAAKVKISPYYFTRLFKQCTNLTPHQYITQCRVEQAKQLLMRGKEESIADIAIKCGFANQSHFTTCFRKITGFTPKVYQNQCLVGK